MAMSRKRKLSETRYEAVVSSHRFREILEHYETKPNSFKDSVAQLSPEDIDPESKLRTAESKSVMEFAPSVVAVSTFRGVLRKMDCSGLIIEWDACKEEGTILTSAKLVRLPEDDERDKYCIIVRLSSGKALLGVEDYVDFHNNILTLKVKSGMKLKAINLQEKQVDPSDEMSVIALGRSIRSCDLLHESGNLHIKHPYFGCEELLHSTCRISEVSEGGPLISNNGCIVGVNFFDNHACALPLPIRVICEYLQLWKSYEVVIRPWFGLTLFNFDQLPLYTVEKLLVVPPNHPHLVVKQVCEGSPADDVSISPGDFVASFDRYSGAEYPVLQDYHSCQLASIHDAVKKSGSVPKATMAVKKYSSPDGVDIIVVKADFVTVSDRRFCYCWPFDESEWSESRPGTPAYAKHMDSWDAYGSSWSPVYEQHRGP